MSWGGNPGGLDQADNSLDAPGETSAPDASGDRGDEAPPPAPFDPPNADPYWDGVDIGLPPGTVGPVADMGFVETIGPVPVAGAPSGFGVGGGEEPNSVVPPPAPQSGDYPGNIPDWDAMDPARSVRGGYEDALDRSRDELIPGVIGLTPDKGVFGFRERPEYDPVTGNWSPAVGWDLGSFVVDGVSTGVSVALGGLGGLAASYLTSRVGNAMLTKNPDPFGIGITGERGGGFNVSDGPDAPGIGLPDLPSSNWGVPPGLDIPDVVSDPDNSGSDTDFGGADAQSAGSSAPGAEREPSALPGFLLAAAAAVEVLG